MKILRRGHWNAQVYLTRYGIEKNPDRHEFVFDVRLEDPAPPSTLMLSFARQLERFALTAACFEVAPKYCPRCGVKWPECEHAKVGFKNP